MAVSDGLMRAILAMDVYNRGYNQGVFVNSNAVGGATLRNDALPAGYEAASFFAQAYTLANGTTIVAYRGSDADSGDSHQFSRKARHRLANPRYQ